MAQVRRSKKHNQQGTHMGKCPDCKGDLWSTQETVVTPVKVAGKWKGVLIHVRCPNTIEEG